MCHGWMLLYLRVNLTVALRLNGAAQGDLFLLLLIGDLLPQCGRGKERG